MASNIEQDLETRISSTGFSEELRRCVNILDNIDIMVDRQEKTVSSIESIFYPDSRLLQHQDSRDTVEFKSKSGNADFAKERLNVLLYFDIEKYENSLEFGSALLQHLCLRLEQQDLMTLQEKHAANI